MPEIKATTKSTTTESTPPVEKLFELPPRRKWNAWYLVVPILLMFALVGGWFMRVFVHEASAPEAVIPAKEVEKDMPKQSNIYYTTITNSTGANSSSTDSSGKLVRLYNYMGSSDTPDVKIADINSNVINVLGKYIKPNTYLVSTSEPGIKILNAKTGQLESLINIDNQGVPRDVAISSDHKWLAYGLTYEGTDDTSRTSELWLYNLETQQKKVLVEKTEMTKHQGFAVLGWRNDDQELIVSALSEDDGVVSGDIYQVMVATGDMTKVTPASSTAMPYFIRGVLSPDNNVWAYTFCEKPDTGISNPITTSQPCTSGSEIRTYNFGTKQTESVFQNLRFENSPDKNLLRSVLSLVWQDDKTIVAAIPGAIIEIDANAKDKVVDLVRYDLNDPTMFQKNQIHLISATPEQIVFERNQGAQVFDRVSKKIEVLNTEARSETFSSWLN